MRFVPVKSEGEPANATRPRERANRALLMTHVAPEMRLRRNAREFLLRQQTQIVNASYRRNAFGVTRAHLGESGPRGPWLG